MYKVVITGGSKGLGKAIKTELGKWHAIPGHYGEIQKQIPGENNITDISRTTGYDLSTEVGIISAKQYVQQEKPDILILNAGVWKNNWRLNYEAPKELAEQMPKDKLVIFILSNAAYRSFGNDDYTAAKSGLLHYANRKQMKGYHFATIAPGTIDTGFWDKAEVDNRQRGAMQPLIVAELVFQIVRAWENRVLVRELIVTPC